MLSESIRVNILKKMGRKYGKDSEPKFLILDFHTKVNSEMALVMVLVDKCIKMDWVSMVNTNVEKRMALEFNQKSMVISTRGNSKTDLNMGNLRSQEKNISMMANGKMAKSMDLV